MSRKCSEELTDALSRQITDLLSNERHIVSEYSAPTKIQSYQDKRFIHRHMNAAVPLDRVRLVECLAESFAKDDSNVLDRVMIIDVKVAFRTDPHIYLTVKGKLGEHVVKETNTR